MTNTPRHFLSLLDHVPETLEHILQQAHELKAKHKAGEHSPLLAGRTLAMIFEKPSTRTRVSFDIAMHQLGGHALTLQKHDLQLGRGETVADTARVLSRYVDAVMLRAHSHSTLVELGRYADVPVVNGLTDKFHPCQLMADLMTVKERLGQLKGLRVAWVGDGNNVCHSWMAAAVQFGFYLRISTPEGFEPTLKLPDGQLISQYASAHEAVEDADVVVTDTWVSMGDDDTLTRKQSFAPFQVNQAMMEKAKESAIFLHCLPAHRGDEVTDEVLDGPQSAVFDEAENRLHAQKAILLWCFGVI